MKNRTQQYLENRKQIFKDTDADIKEMKENEKKIKTTTDKLIELAVQPFTIINEENSK